MSTHEAKPLYKSSRWTAFVLVVVAFIVSIVLKAPPSSIDQLAMAIFVGLPVLLGGESWRRIVADRPQRTTVATSTPLGASVTTTGGQP